MQKRFFYISIVMTLTSCNLFPNLDLAGMFYGSSPRADVRFDESMDWNDAHPYLSIEVPSENYEVYVAADTHVDSTSRNISEFVRLYHAAPACPLAIHLGDMINAKGNYPRYIEALASQPAVPIPGKKDTLMQTCGNHDIYYGQWSEFKNYFKTSVYWFDTRKAGKKLDLFICLDSSSGTLGRKQIEWLRNLLREKSEEGYRHIIVYTHTHMFKQDATQETTSNYSMEETRELTGLFAKYHVSMYWAGHDHSREVTLYGGVTYITVDSMQDPVEAYYMLVNMADQIRYQFVPINRVDNP